MSEEVLLAVGTASIFATIALGVLAKWMSGTLRRFTDTVAAVAVAAQTAPDSDGDSYTRVRKLELEVKAIDDDLGQLRESVKRWQGRVNRQSARDAQEVVTEDDPEKMSQFDLLAPGGRVVAPAGNAKPGQRPRLLPRVRTSNRG